MSTATINAMSTREIRELIRRGELKAVTTGLAPGYTQANLAVLPREVAFDFLLFCQRNPKPCPLLEVVEAGSYEVAKMAPGSDIRKDISLYRTFKDGEMIAEVEDVSEYWRDDLVSFLLGCSFTFETPLIKAGISLRHVDQGKNVSMYSTYIETAPAGIFSGPMVVSMRPIPHRHVVRAVQITSRFPAVHGAPVHIGDPAIIGIMDISKPDFGDAVEIKEDEVPIFWACGVTPQAVAIRSKPSFMIAHSPGHMFITDVPDEDLAVL